MRNTFQGLIFRPLALCLCLAAGPGLCLLPKPASAWVGPLENPAYPVVHPAQALLINIAHAGDRLVAVGEHGLIIYSDDNGKTWRQAPCPTSETLTSIGFANAKDGWAAGGQGVVLHTTDGGLSWKIQLTGDEVLKLMANAAKRYAAADPTSTASMRAVRRAGIFVNAGNNKPFLSVLPLSPQSAIIFGAYRMTVRTTDGGKHWEDWSLHVGDPISHNIYQAVRIGQDIYLAGEAGDVLRSTDGGQNFTMLNQPGTSTMFGILGTPKGTLLAYGVSGEVFRSTDQGQSWTPPQISVDSDITDGLVLRSGAILLVTEAGDIYESKDDGQSFRQVPPNEGMGLFSLTQAANGDVVLIGSGGVRVVPAAAFD